MKKILPLIMLAIMSIIVSFTSVYAFDSSEWTLNQQDGYYYYNTIQLNRDDQMTKTLILTPQNNQFLEYKNMNSGGWVNSQYKNAKIILETQPGAAATRIWDIYIIELDENNQEISTPKYIVYASWDKVENVPLSNFVQFRFKNFGQPTEYDTVESLLTTTGNPFTSTGTMGDVTTSLDGYNLSLQITYNGQVRYLLLPLAPNTDLTPYQANNAIYYTDSGNKYIAFSHDPVHSMLSPTSDHTGYVPYTILNLNTMETKTFEVLSVYIHLKATTDTKKDLYGYFYMDQFVIDNLETATVIYSWRYQNPLFNSGWKQARVKVESGETTGSGSDWYTKYMTVMTLGLPLLFDGNIFNDLTIEQIAKVNWNQETFILRDELDVAYRNQALKDGFDFDGIRDTMDVYKLYLGNHNNPLATSIGIDEDSVQVINVVYTKDGHVQTIHAKDIDTRASIDDELIPREPVTKDLFDWLTDIWENYRWAVILVAVIIAFVLLALFVFPIIARVKENTRRVFKSSKRRRRR